MSPKTNKLDSHPALKGKQKKSLPDKLQALIIKKKMEKTANIAKVKANLAAGMSMKVAIKNAYPNYTPQQVNALAMQMGGMGKMAKANPDREPFSSYRMKRDAALYSSGMSPDARLRMLRSAFSGRAKDKKPTKDAGMFGAISGGMAGGAASIPALHHIVQKVGRPSAKGKAVLVAAFLASVGGGGAAGKKLMQALPERERRFAERMSKDPEGLRAVLQMRRRTGMFGRRRMRQEADLLRDYASARKGKKPSSPFISIEK